jgi:hypothetical protein
VSNESPLFRKLKRRLARRDEILHKSVEDKNDHQLGDYYTTALYTGAIIRHHVQLDALARELKVTP